MSLLPLLLMSVLAMEPDRPVVSTNPIFEIFNPGVGIKFREVRQGDVLFPVSINNWWGYMNQSGDLVVWPCYDWTEETYDDLSRVVQDGRTGFVNKAGRFQINPTYPWIDRFAESYAMVRGKDGYGFLDKTEKLIVPAKLTAALRFSEGYAAVQVGEQCGFVDRRGVAVVEPRYKRLRSFHDGFAAVESFAKDAKPRFGLGPPPGIMGYIDIRGEPVFVDKAREFTELGDFYEGMARVKTREKWGYIDKSFKARIDAQFDEARDFSGTMAAVRVGKRWGYIYKTGDWAIEPQFDWAHDFVDGMALIKLNGKFGYLDVKGAYRIVPQFDWAYPLQRGLFRASVEPSFGYAGVAGNVVWHPKAPFVAIWDLTGKGRALRVEVSPLPASIKVFPPTPREAVAVPYHPDWQYRDHAQLPWDDWWPKK